jgi:hypothetical protein
MDMMDFKQYVTIIKQVHTLFESGALKTVNISLALINWVIGYYISEYEPNGFDRAEYRGGRFSKYWLKLIEIT